VRFIGLLCLQRQQGRFILMFLRNLSCKAKLFNKKYLQLCKNTLMRRSNTETLGEVIQRLLKAYGLEQKLNESKIYDAWPEVVGEAIAQRTKRLAIVNRVLFVYLNSSVVKAELLRIKESLPQVLNRKVGLDLIDEVVIR